MYLLISNDHLYHSLWISVNAGKDLLLKAYWLGGKPVFSGGQGLGVVSVQIELKIFPHK